MKACFLVLGSGFIVENSNKGSHDQDQGWRIEWPFLHRWLASGGLFGSGSYFFCGSRDVIWGGSGREGADFRGYRAFRGVRLDCSGMIFCGLGGLPYVFSFRY